MTQTNNATPAANRWRVRPAQPADYRALRILLPESVHFGAGSVVWAATPVESAQVIAAATLSPRFSGAPVSGGRVAVHVIPPWRRLGIAKALLGVAGQLAQAHGAQAIFAHTPVESGRTTEQAWRSLGFDQSNSMQVSQVDLPRAELYLRPLHQQLLEHGWIPAEAKIVTLRQINPADVAVLHAKYLGGTVRDLMLRLSGQTLEPLHPTLSPVLLLDGVVKAFTLVRLVGQACHVEATVVDPSLRNGWANLWLKYQGICWALAAGAKTMVFQTYDRHTDTRKLSRQMGGVTQTLVEPYRLLQQ